MKIASVLAFVYVCFADSSDIIPDAATLFAYRQATIDSIRNFEVESYCVMKSASESNRETIFGPLTYRRSGTSVMFVNASQRAFSQDLVTPEQTKSLESTPGKKPKFGIVDKPSGAHFCRDPWYFSRYVTTRINSKKQIPLTEVYSQEDFQKAKVDKISIDIYRVVFGENDSKTTYELDRSIGYQFRKEKIDSVATELGGQKVAGKNFKYSSEVTYEDYVFIDKIPIAKTIREHTVFLGDTTDIVMKLSKISVNSPEIDRKMTLDFSVGLKVNDYVDQVSYKVGKNGERLEVEPIQITRVMPPESNPSVTLTPTPPDEAPSYSTYRWVLPSSIVLLVVALVVRWRLRRGQGDS